MEHELKNVVDHMLDRSTAFTFASVSTVDGRSATFTSGNISEAARVAAVASSLLALSESFSREVQQGSSHWTTINNAGGTIVLVRVPSRQRRHVLAVGADKSQNLATTLHYVVQAAEQLAAVIDASATAVPEPLHR